MQPCLACGRSGLRADGNNSRRTLRGLFATRLWPRQGDGGVLTVSMRAVRAANDAAGAASLSLTWTAASCEGRKDWRGELR